MALIDNEKRKKTAKFTSDEIELAVLLIKELENTLDIIYYLLEKELESAFVILLLSAEDSNVDKIVQSEKRKTDILFEIDREKALYAVICQDTQVDGAFNFASRILDRMKKSKAKDIYCTALEVRSTKLNIKTIIFKLIETYLESKEDKRSNEIVYRSIN